MLIRLAVELLQRLPHHAELGLAVALEDCKTLTAFSQGEACALSAGVETSTKAAVVRSRHALEIAGVARRG